MSTYPYKWSVGNLFPQLANSFTRFLFFKLRAGEQALAFGSVHQVGAKLCLAVAVRLEWFDSEF